MSHATMRTMEGPQSYEVAELVIGGQVVEARANKLIGVAAAASNKVLGIATTDGIQEGGNTTVTTDAVGRPVVNAMPLPKTVSVAAGGIEVAGVLFAAAAEFGDALVAAANGAVTPAGATPDARQVVGRCTTPGGVAANARGRVRTA